MRINTLAGIFGSIFLYGCGCVTNLTDYDHKPGETIVNHDGAEYRVCAELRKRDQLLQVTIEPRYPNVSLNVNDIEHGFDQSKQEWIAIYLTAKYQKTDRISNNYIDNTSVKIINVDEFTQNGKSVGIIPLPERRIEIQSNGDVKFDDKFETTYFKNGNEKVIQPRKIKPGEERQ